MKIRKRAFTLTELLVVVIVIGVLAAVVLPKFSKVMETRKTTEAEEVMSAIRTEQEHRCALDKPYYGDINDLAEILPNNDTKHYTYSLDTVGMMASSKGTYSYTLKMPSYLDGRICCEGAECDKLNKDYPTCTDLTQKADYEEETDCAATGIAPTPSCSGPSVETCGCNGAGTRSRTCDPDTGTWSDWSGCSAPEACECTDDEYEDCDCGQRVHQCDPLTGQWSGYDDSGCSAYQDGVQTETEPCDISGSKFRSRNVRHCGDVDSPKEILDDWTSWDMSSCEEKGFWKECTTAPAGDACYDMYRHTAGRADADATDEPFVDVGDYSCSNNAVSLCVGVNPLPADGNSYTIDDYLNMYAYKWMVSDPNNGGYPAELGDCTSANYSARSGSIDAFYCYKTMIRTSSDEVYRCCFGDSIMTGQDCQDYSQYDDDLAQEICEEEEGGRWMKIARDQQWYTNGDYYGISCDCKRFYCMPTDQDDYRNQYERNYGKEWGCEW